MNQRRGARRKQMGNAGPTSAPRASRVRRDLLPPRRFIPAVIAFLLILWSSALAQQDTNRAGLVIRYGDGRVETYCVAFAEPSITGAELLRRAGVEVIMEYNASMGEAICKIGGDGCDYPLEPCFCQCQGADCKYWAYYHLQEGTWVYSQVGAGNYQVTNGSVEGWAWGAGEPGQGAVPPVIPFRQICALDTPTPTHTPTITPSSTPTPSPIPTPTPTPLPPPTPTATFTPEPERPSPSPTPALILPATQPSTNTPPTSVPTLQASPTQTPTATPAPPLPTEAPTATPTASPSPTPSPHVSPTLPPNAVRVTPPRPNPARVLVTPTPAASTGKKDTAPADLLAFAGTMLGLGGIAVVVYLRGRRPR